MEQSESGEMPTLNRDLGRFLESRVYLEVAAALQSYVGARKELLDLGVIRSTRTVQADLGEWIAAKTLGLTLCESGVEPGFDATDLAGKRYQIKTRLVAAIDRSTSFDFKKPIPEFDVFVGVLLGPGYRPLALISANRDAVLSHCNENRATFRFRWKKELLHSGWLAYRRFK